MPGPDVSDGVGVGQPSRTDRFYVVGRADLDLGPRVAQIVHAAIDWVVKHGAPPETLAVLQVPGRLALEELLTQRLRGRVEGFREPDLGNQLTAIAAGPECWRNLSSVRLLR